MHLAIFLGMCALFIGTALATVDLDVTHLFFGFQFLRGDLYLGYKLVLDLFAAALLAGLGLAFWRRYALKPERLKTLTHPTFPLDSFYLLAILFLIGTTGLIAEACAWRRPSRRGPAGPRSGNALAAAFRPLPEPALRAAHIGVWSAHGLLAFGFIALVPQSKAFHMVSSAVSIFLRNLGAVGAPAGGRPGAAWRRCGTSPGASCCSSTPAPGAGAARSSARRTPAGRRCPRRTSCSSSTGS